MDSYTKKKSNHKTRCNIWLAFNFGKEDLFASTVALTSHQDLVLMGVGLQSKFFSSTFQRFSVWLRSGLCGGQIITLPEPLFHSVSPLDPGIVILEYARVIREEQIHWWDRLFMFT